MNSLEAFKQERNRSDHATIVPLMSAGDRTFKKMYHGRHADSCSAPTSLPTSNSRGEMKDSIFMFPPRTLYDPLFLKIPALLTACSFSIHLH